MTAAARLHYAAALDAVRADRDRLKAAIVAHHAQKADDRALYEAAGLPVGDPPSETLKNCEQFLNRPNADGSWPSYAELEVSLDALVARVKELEAQLDALVRDPAYRQGALTELRCIVREARVIGNPIMLNWLLGRLVVYQADE